MHCSKALLLITLFCATSLVAQNVYDVYPERIEESDHSDVGRQKSETRNQKSEGEKVKILTGFTGGMKVHVGYAFAKSPDELFRNGNLQELTNLSTNGITLGLGGELRLHLINHIHLGAEGGVSTMPLAQSGSSIRTGWGGALCDFYGQVGKVQLMAGGLVGGGVNKRLYVPDGSATSSTDPTYNASYTSTSFFLLDPYVGLECKLTKRISIIIQVDYMLPFGSSNSGLNTETIRWNNFLSPSGPRLYVGLLFGKHDFRQDRR